LEEMRLSGFLVSIHSAIESTLEVEVDASHLEWGEYRSLVEELEDVLHAIDEQYSVKSELMKGRSLRARYRRVTAEERRRKLRFSPFPSKFTNVLKNLRAYVYTSLVPSTCLCIERIGHRKVYLLPKAMAPTLLEAVDRINSKVIGRVRREIEEFRDSDEYFEIAKCLHRHRIDPAVLKTAAFAVGDYVVDVVPTNFGYDVDEDDYYARLAREERVRGLEILRRQVERRHREYVAGAVRDVVERLRPLVERGRRPRKKIEKLVELCRSAGLDEVCERLLEPLREVCAARPADRDEVAKRHFGTADLKEAVENALREFL